MTDLKKCLETLEKCKALQERDVQFICEKAKEILTLQPNVVEVKAPVTVCGDIHGQFYDLLEIFEISGSLPNTNYLFMGDYVDRGFNGVQTLSYVLVLKILYKDRITLLRGNHESKQINKIYGFYEQCMKKYSNQNVWNMFTDLFSYLPLAATIEGQFYCLHGGLSPCVGKIDQIKDIERRQKEPSMEAMVHMLWSDPENDMVGFGQSPRGVGVIWGCDETDKFIHINKLKKICRAHQLTMDGLKEQHNNQCLTVFSAPNYCYRCGNLASIVEIDELLNTRYQQYEPAPRDLEPRTVKRVPAYFL